MRDEIDVLRSIFTTEEDAVLKLDEDNDGGTFFIHAIPPSTPYTVKYPGVEKKKRKKPSNLRESCAPNTSAIHERDDQVSLDLSSPIENSFTIEHLQPFELKFRYVPGYPEQECPKFLLKCSWLSKRDLSRLCHKMHDMWSTDRSDILYTWVMFLQSESLNYLEYGTSLDLKAVVRWSHYCVNCECIAREWTKQSTINNDVRAHVVKSGYAVIGELQQYNMLRRDYLFNREIFSCNICLEYERGLNCVKLNCGHINCRKCVAKLVKNLVKEGDYGSIRCPDESCRVELTMDVINVLGSKELIKRYTELKKITDLQAQGLLVYCPRTFCMKPTASDPRLNLALCSSCKLAFCTACKSTYHGINPCKLFRNQKERQRILEQYQEGDDKTRERLEMLYGRRTLQRAVDDMLSEKEIENMCKPCPHCKSQIEKFEGCNKVHCVNCHQFFCWICSVVLDRSSPYDHFSNPQSQCYRKLFQGVYDPDAELADDLIIEFIEE